MRFNDFRDLISFASPAKASAPILPTNRFDMQSRQVEGAHDGASVVSETSSIIVSILVGSPAYAESPSHSAGTSQTSITLTADDLMAKPISAPLQKPMHLKEKLRNAGSASVAINTLGQNVGHQLVKLATTGYRALATSPATFLGSRDVQGSTILGASRVVGVTLFGNIMPRVVSAHFNDFTRSSTAKRDSQNPWLKRALLALAAINVLRDPASEGSALVLGTAGALAVGHLPPLPGPLSFAPKQLPWLLSEVGRIGVPMITHSIARAQRIAQIEAYTATLSTEEDLDRPWTRMAFVGGHLPEDTGNVPFFRENLSVGPLAELGRFSSHQSLTLEQQIDRGYDAFAIEVMQDAQGELHSSHSIYWSFGPLKNTFTKLAEGLDRNPNAIFCIKLSDQNTVDYHNVNRLFEESGLARHYNQEFQFESFKNGVINALTKRQLIANDHRIILLSANSETIWDGESIQPLFPKFANYGDAAIRPEAGTTAEKILNIFTSWGFQPWSEYVNLFSDQLLQDYANRPDYAWTPLNVIFSNDLETSNLLAFKRAFNAPGLKVSI